MTDRNAFALEATGLAKRYRRVSALDGCTVGIPTGRISALVGPNGAGKTTLMTLACGLITPTGGDITVLGARPTNQGMPPGVAYLAQEKPLYRDFTVAEMVLAGDKLNPGFDTAFARSLLADADVPSTARIKTLSGGQRTRVALALVLGRRPRLLIMDEPLADLDPLARKQVMQTVMSYVADTQATVLLSSHVIADLEEVCDHLVLLTHGHVQLHGDVEELLEGHRLAIGPRTETLPFPAQGIVEATHSERTSTVVVRGDAPVSSDWEVTTLSLEELVLSYMRCGAKAVAA